MIKAKFSRETKKKILERDKFCICPNCKTPYDGQHFHHVWYGQEAQYDEGRNGVDRGVLLCYRCHDAVHFKSGGRELNETFKIYLKKYE